MEFWKEHQFIPVDARYGGMPVDAAAQLFGGKPKAKDHAKRWTWDDCTALAQMLNVTLSPRVVLFADGSFEHGKQYSFRNPSQCYEALLSLQRDRLARLSDAEAIAASEQAKDFFN